MTAENNFGGEADNQSDTNRRDFLRKSAGAVLGASFIGPSETAIAADRATNSAAPENAEQVSADSSTAGREAPASIPPHDAIRLPGVHGYAQRSLAAGETLRMRMSADVAHRVSIRRLGVKVDDPASDQVLHSIDVAEPRIQPIHPGSYVHVLKGLESDKPFKAFSLECWLRPWALNRQQGVITQQDESSPSGIGLVLTSHGELAFHCGADETTNNACNLLAKFPVGHTWRHLVATWDGHTAQLFIDGQKVATTEFTAIVTLSNGPLRLGANGANGKATQFLDGDLAAPAIYFAALSHDLVKQRFKVAGLSPPETAGLAAYWPLNEECGPIVRDISGNERHGQVINRGTWMIGGPSFDAASVTRHGDYDPDADPKRGHGLRLASDDLYDCRWEVDHEFEIPPEAAPGIYVADAVFDRGSKTYHYPITFVVRRAPRRPVSDILVLCATSTWTAYSSTPFAVNTHSPLMWGTDGIKNSHDNAPAYSCYRNHRAGQPTFQLGLNMPWPAAGPDVRYSPPEVGYSHLMRAERYLQAWLETKGYGFDVASDLDLHRNPAILDRHKVVIINGHSEYWSREAYQAVERFLARGGTLVVLSGNTMFWRTTFDDEVMECRKFDDRIGGRPNAQVGELYHAHDHRRGGLMRECGLPAWRVVGLDAAGWGAVDQVKEFAPFTVTDADHPFFTTPTPTNLRKGDTFGHAADPAGPRAVGHEWDVRLSQLVRMTGPLPEGLTLPDEPAGIRTLAQGILGRVTALDYLTRATKLVEGVAAELIDWQRPAGGRVINFGSIGVGWALEVDPKLQTVLQNVLHTCGVAQGAALGANS